MEAEWELKRRNVLEVCGEKTRRWDELKLAAKLAAKAAAERRENRKSCLNIYLQDREHPAVFIQPVVINSNDQISPLTPANEKTTNRH